MMVKDNARSDSYEYAIIVSRSVQAKVSCLLCTLSDYIFILTWVFLCLVYLQGYPTPQSVDEQKWIPAFYFMWSILNKKPSLALLGIYRQ